MLLLLAGPAGAADDFSAELDRTQVRANETLTLRLRAGGRLGGEPDLTPLNQDFEILNQSTGSRMSISNGTVSQTREWTLELAPRRAGRLRIPPLSLGGTQTSPVTVEVVPADQTAAGTGSKPIFVDTQVENTKPYVQQSFVYLVRVLYREQPRRAVLSEPEAEGATLERQGEDQSSSETIQGQRYTVIERRYLVVPQRSGPLTIASPRLEALLPESRSAGRRSPFADFNDPFGNAPFQDLPDLFDMGSGRRVIERGQDLTVQVRPQPNAGNGTWLPAESVQLSEEWTPAPPRFRVGEPVTRTLVITARGATAAQLPTLDPGTPEGAKVYPEPPKVEDLPGPAPTALKTLKIALVPTRAGELILPEIRVPWWDTTADQERVAVIPARRVQVEPAPGEPASPQPTPGATATDRPAVSAPDQDPADTPLATHDTGVDLSDSSTTVPWPWLTLFFALAWLATLSWTLVRRSGRGGTGRVAATPMRPHRGEATARTRLRQACTAADPKAARAALLDWGLARWPHHPPRGLGDIGTRLGLAGSATADILEHIDRAVYAPGGAAWDGAAAWRALEPTLLVHGGAGRALPVDPLPHLYPRPEG
ncbi:BatD family protein [uncultured Lamprocystis sp.]|jgi:hypothetical protein|nr:BatD family protein [uncultured Lamprocystis sp.]